MSSATFTHTNGSITFTRAPQRPDKSLAVIQPQRKSAGGTRFGYAHTIVNNALRLRLRMTSVEKDAFIAFFNTTVGGMAEAFNYTDVMGRGQSVRFAEPTLGNLIEKAYNAWEITIGLRIFGGAWMFSDGSTQLYSDGSEVTYA